MNAATRRMAIWHTLCCRRHIKMRELAEMYGVTTRTIRLDVEHLSLTYPIETVRGRYDGCVKIPDWYIPTTSPLNAIQMDFLVNLQKTMVGTDADMLRGIISGVVSLKRGNSFLVQKKHSDYENPNACGRM